MAERKTVATKAKGQPFQAAKPYQLPPLDVQFVEGEEFNTLKVQRKYPNAAPVSETAIQMSTKMLADLGTGARVPLPKEHQEKEQRAKIKAELHKDLLRVVTRQGRKDLSVRCIDTETELVFWYEPKRVQTPKVNKGDSK